MAIASVSPAANNLISKIIVPMLAVPPFSLGFPSDITQSNYYPSDERISREEIAAVSRLLEAQSIEPKNTRLRKTTQDGKLVLEVVQASAETMSVMQEFIMSKPDAVVRVKTGDHAVQMSKICASLEEATRYTANENQSKLLLHYIDSFQTGNMVEFRESQKVWVADQSPSVENVFGFVEPYRDPHGRRAEWEGVICVSDRVETERLKQFVDKSSVFIRLLHWAVPGVNDGMGPFEKTLFEPPDFTITHGV